MFGSLDLPAEWSMTTFSEVAELQLGKKLDRAKNQGEETLYIRNANVRWGEFDLSDLLTMPMMPRDRERLDIRDGDLLVCEGGEPGRCAVWTLGPNKLSFQMALIRVRPRDGVLSHYLEYYLRYMHLKGYLASFSIGATIQHLSQAALGRIPLILPPRSHQEIIVKKN